jgi:hypothetical protein
VRIGRDPPEESLHKRTNWQIEARFITVRPWNEPRRVEARGQGQVLEWRRLRPLDLEIARERLN